MNQAKHILLLMCLFGASFSGIRSQDQRPACRWSFDGISDRKTVESISAEKDTIEGKYLMVKGVKGQALRLDGFTCVVRHPADKSLSGATNLTVDAWIALGAYPWNWCPVLSQYKEEEGGFSFEIGPKGELGMRQWIGGNPLACISEGQIPLNTWTHIAATVESGKGIRLFINGVESGKYETAKRPSYSSNAETRIGMNAQAVYTAYRIGTEGGDQPYWFSLDGIVDEISVFREILSDSQLLDEYRNGLPADKPDLPVRHLPDIQPTGRFQAYYAKLKYYDMWDEQWPVAEDPDVVVTFDESPVKMVFWRGTRFSPAWVTDNNLWMADQSVETWSGPEGCLEHMQDRHCKYSHVRIIENTPARKVVQWRYAPVSAYDKLRVVDDKTGWSLWIDEYYYVYPDATAIRKVSWKTGEMVSPVQFQETLPLTGEGQLRGDVIEPDYLWVANMQGDKQHFDYVEDPAAGKSKKIPEDPNIQRHNFRSDYDPFIIFEPGNEMEYISDRDIRNLQTPGSCNHWPVGQAYCDGRRALTTDRPTHFLGFPISYPVIHDGPDGRSWLNSLYGMKNVPIDELVTIAHSWATAPVLKLKDDKFYESMGFDLSQKCYRIRAHDGSGGKRLEMTLAASKERPLYHPAILVENWGDRPASVRIDGQELKDGKDFRQGKIERLDGTHLILWLDRITEKPVGIEVTSDE